MNIRTLDIRTLGILSLAIAAPFGVAATGAVVSTVAVAQWSGPSDTKQAPQPPYAKSTIAAIKAAPKDDQKVTLVGTIVRKTGDETYLFSDGTGEIVVDIDDDAFPKQPVTERTQIQIEGEVDTHLMRDADIDAERVTILK